MDDRDQLKRHYDDVFDSVPDADLLQMVDELHQAAVLCRQGEPSAAVDQAIAQLARPRRQTSATNGTVACGLDDDATALTQEEAPPPTRLRTGWFRQGLGMVAAIAVLLLVGGILAVTFGNQQHSQQGGLGGAATATAPSLPMTVTASNLRITLSSAKLNGSQIVLTFKIESADPNQPNMWTVGGGEFTGLLVPENDVVANGLKWDAQSPETSVSPLVPPGFTPPPPAPSPTPQPTPDIVGYQETLPFVLTGPADQPVTVTIQKVRFDNGPSTPPPGKIINGTWSFTFVPAALGAPPLPTPDRLGSYSRLSLAQAQQLVDFPIATPNPLPGVLQPLPDSIFSASAVGLAGNAKANYVTFYYPAVNMAEKGVSVLETSADSAVPTVRDNTIYWVGENGKTTTIPTSQVTQSDLTINGVQVTKWMTEQQGTTVVYYLWDRAGVHDVAYTVPKIQVTEAVMEQFVRAMISPSTATRQAVTTPTPSTALPTPNADGQTVLTFKQAQQLAPFYVTQPRWVPSVLVDEGIEVPQWQGAEPPGSPIQEIMLSYRGKDPGQMINVQITEELEHVPRGYSNASTPVAITIAGHSVTRTDIVAISGTLIKDYLWQQQGTTFELTGTIAGPLTEQDLEHMIASMFNPTSAASTPETGASATTIPLPTLVAVGGSGPLTFDQVQQEAHYYLAQPTWLPPYLVTGGVMIGDTTPPGTTPTTQEVHVCVLRYLPADSSQHFSVAIREFDSTVTPDPVVGSTTTLTIGGQAVTRTVPTRSAPGDANIVDFRWSTRGTYFWVAAQIAGPLNEQDVERMIASMLSQAAESATPAPSGVQGSTGTGSGNHLTVSQAQELAGFAVVEPGTLPSPLGSNPATVSASHIGNSGAGKANYVEFFYPLSQTASGQGMYLVETTNQTAAPTINGETASFVSPDGTHRTVSIIRGTEAQIGIQGVVVTKFDVADSNSRQTYLTWNDHGVSSYVEVTRSGAGTVSPVDEGGLQQMVGGLIEARRGPGWWSSSVMTDVLALLRGLILAFILVVVYRLRHIMLWARAIFVIVAIVTAFLFVDGIVRGPRIADLGLVVGGAVVLGAVLLYERWRHMRSHAVR